MINPFHFTDSPEFSNIFSDATPKQPSASPRPFTQMEHSFVIDEAEQKLLNPVNINVSPEQPPYSTPAHLKLNWQKRCKTFFQNRKVTPVNRRKSLTLIPPSPISGALNNDLSFKDTEMVTNRSLMDLSIASTKIDMGSSNDSWMVTGRNVVLPEELDCDMEQGCSGSPTNAVFTPPLEKSTLMVASPSPAVLLSGSRVEIETDSRNVSRIKQRLDWDWSPIRIKKNSLFKRREPKEMFKKRRARKRVKARQRVRSFLRELDPNIQRDNSKQNLWVLKNNFFER